MRLEIQGIPINWQQECMLKTKLIEVREQAIRQAINTNNHCVVKFDKENFDFYIDKFDLKDKSEDIFYTVFTSGNYY